MKGVTVAVVEDEAIARAGIVRLLRALRDVEAVYECRNGIEAIATIRDLQPDILFLDVQMPGIDAFGVIDAVRPENMPVTVFVTAFDEYAIRAFDLNAADYLMKPFDRDRLTTAFDRARARLLEGTTNSLQKQVGVLTRLLGAQSHSPNALRRIALQNGDDVELVDLADIDWMESVGNYLRVRIGTGVYMKRGTLSEVEATLKDGGFLRISRSVMVNEQRIRAMRRCANGIYTVVLRDGSELPASRRYSERIREFIARNG